MCTALKFYILSQTVSVMRFVIYPGYQLSLLKYLNSLIRCLALEKLLPCQLNYLNIFCKNDDSGRASDCCYQNSFVSYDLLVTHK